MDRRGEGNRDKSKVKRRGGKGKPEEERRKKNLRQKAMKGGGKGGRKHKGEIKATTRM